MLTNSDLIPQSDGSIRVANRIQNAASPRRPASGKRSDSQPSHPSLLQGNLSDIAVEVSPSDIVARHRITSDGMGAEVVQVTRRERTEFHFDAPVHLLALFERGTRSEGVTSVSGLPPSLLKDLGRKLIFVPAGHSYHDWQQPNTLSRVVYFYLDPARLPKSTALAAHNTLPGPRLFFEDTALWGTAIKLAGLIESSKSIDRLYFDALSDVLAHEIVQLARVHPRIAPPVRGGIAPWQQRIVVDYIEEHLDEHIPLATLAHLARLSPYYFCRAFKQSFGVPPHRYHTGRRIERAKWLLAQPRSSVTNVALSVGFRETSSFTVAFRKATDLTPTAYRRSLA